MPNYICITCGTQFDDSEELSSHCLICEDQRQFVNWEGQQWTTVEQLTRTHRNSFKTVENNLIGIGTEPPFALGQRALLIRTSEGNVLWDCISLIDDATIDIIQALGGLEAIAVSHPHYFASMVEWSHAFGNIPIYLHEANEKWVMRPDPVIEFWKGETQDMNSEITLIRCGGHFRGGTVLHCKKGAQGRGALLTGDIIQVAMDRRHVSFMYSYPNLIPLSEIAVLGIVDSLQPFEFDRIYGAWWGRNILTDAKSVLAFSAKRYLGAMEKPA
ncbi:MBL fold metallo-hydrolase [candidate division KSB1 bacterium]|nr:MBL fold metallo-hydrolase [candidate division KSB1 bacterium]NIR72032.1 MBL fold metallo-hydrolase [candidate division KSB1 bacterium]NIS25973.1 MBL fold metallo-hydrolase [candidate division KSB1 bacterium]NIT74944.1 MBL fold metallo-hydrolase [candidate division KSB1 bacterium]NIU28728.1 MBL fold metallo-hydrolase [candidate division KSB1 bacterium]